ncbi:MAG: hypothetical protein EKK55_17440 [Rhodocyclaceae bacterium]|nr:MAG: hypothetical protein EKK55_17440 [Rhodocyclaceae bacterium]
MSRLSIEQLVTTPSTLNYLNESAYDSTKWNVGKGIIYNNGASAIDKYIAPIFDVAHPMEESTAFAVSYVQAYNFSPNIAYLFGVENSTGATATRRVHLWEINRKTGARSWKGFITLTLATATAHTVRDFKIDYKRESTGTVQVSGTAVTGSSTLFATNKVAIGARIGFGSTDPKQITTWYRISARASDTGITLGSSAGTIGAGTAYVIEEFRPVYYATNATTTNGGIHYAKGVSIEDFTSGGTTIALAVATDDQKAVYWLKDAATQTDITGAGMAMDVAAATPTSLEVYTLTLPVAGSYKVFKYNIRAALTVASGNSVSAWILATGNQAFTGTGSQNANLSIATAAHGLGSGVKSLYFVTTSRIYRAAVANITSGSVTWFSDNISELTPGGANTYAVTSTLSTIQYLNTADVFIVGTTHATANFSYITQYVASGAQFQNIFGRDARYLDQSTKDSNCPTHFSNNTTVFSYDTTDDGNMIFAVKQGTAASNNQIYIMAFGADDRYAATNQGYVISPSIPTPNALKYYRAFANHVGYVGAGTFIKPTEKFDLYARTANITTDATTGWVLVDETNDISSFAGAANIQFKIQFRTIGEWCVPARLLGINLAYEDNTTDSHYAISVAKSDLANKRFAFWFKTAFGGTVPTLTIRLYDADTGGLLLTDNTASPTLGTFEKTTDGTTWGAYNTTDRANATTWIRYTPTSLADSIKVAAYLTQG